MESIVKALLKRNHEVTWITSFPLTLKEPLNYTEILVEPRLEFDELSKFSNDLKKNTKERLQ